MSGAVLRTPDGTEDLAIRWLPFEEVLAMTLDGRISDVMTVVAVERLALLRLRGAAVSSIDP